MIRQDRAVIQGLCSPALLKYCPLLLWGEHRCPSHQPQPQLAVAVGQQSTASTATAMLHSPKLVSTCMMPQQPMDAYLLPPTAVPRERPAQPQHACGSSRTRGEQTPVCLHLWVLTKNRGEHPCPQCRWRSRHHRKDYLSKVMW